MALSILKAVLYLIAILVGVVFLYFLVAVIFSLITVNSGFEQADDGVAIYLKSNGAHVDIYTPLRNEVFDWTMVINLEEFEPGNHQFVAVGWGDGDHRELYAYSG